MTASIGWLLTRMRAMPAAAAMAISGACSRRPAGSSSAPWRPSLPRRCTQRQASARAAALRVAWPGTSASSSTGTTLSQPAGSTAPVITWMQWSASASDSGGSPAAWVAWMRKVRAPALAA